MLKKGQSGKAETAFEKSFVSREKKPNAVIKTGSIVLYATVAVAVIVCAVMAVLDKTGVAPTVTTESDKRPAVTEPVDVSAYPESLQKLYNENFEAGDFVVSYFKEKDKQKEVSLKSYKKSEEVPLFIQWDKQWGYLQYGNDFAGVNADGPMCLAMVGYYLTRDEKFSPDKIIAFTQENGYYQQGKGTLSVLMTEGAQKLGLSGQRIAVSKESMVDSLNQGKPLVCFVNAGSFTSRAHFIVVRAYGDDYFLINDPYSIINSEKEWNIDELLPQLRAAWAFSAAAE